MATEKDDPKENHVNSEIKSSPRGIRPDAAIEICPMFSKHGTAYAPPMKIALRDKDTHEFACEEGWTGDFRAHLR